MEGVAVYEKDGVMARKLVCWRTIVTAAGRKHLVVISCIVLENSSVHLENAQSISALSS